MKKLIKTGKEIDRILESGIEILPNSPIHEKLKQALNIACVSGSSIPPPPPPPLYRVITVGVGHLCNNCNSTMPRSGFLGLIGERLCDNKKCPNSKSQKNYR